MALDHGVVFIGAFQDSKLAINNAGNASLRVDPITIEGNHAFRLLQPTGEFAVAAGGKQIVTVRFKPVHTGEVTGRLVIDSTDPDEPRLGVPLSGDGEKRGA